MSEEAMDSEIKLRRLGRKRSRKKGSQGFGNKIEKVR